MGMSDIIRESRDEAFPHDEKVDAAPAPEESEVQG